MLQWYDKMLQCIMYLFSVLCKIYPVWYENNYKYKAQNKFTDREEQIQLSLYSAMKHELWQVRQIRMC